MPTQTLEEIQALQFHDPQAASSALRDLFNDYLPFQIVGLMVRPLAVSLNSINGFLDTADGRRLFFKTHVEPQSIVDEYYNSSILAEAGYPVLRPVHSVTEPGRQVLIYELVDVPSLFDVVREAERGQRHDSDTIVALQQQSDRELWQIYQHTLRQISADEHARAPVHQLFYHRLTGGRYATFYTGQQVALPEHTLPFERLKQLTWEINGTIYRDTLADLVQRAIALLNPARSATPAIVGHGDAHNGNIFFDQQQARLFYFDPAFAGRHAPLLDLTKPLFHNIFAIWLYFPHEIARDLSLRYHLRGDTMVVQHDFAPSPLRLELLRSKTRLVLQPLLHELRTRTWLAPDWRNYLKAALFCCPFLTMNLRDLQKFPPAITLLGLCLCIEMGSSATDGPASLLDAELDQMI